MYYEAFAFLRWMWRAVLLPYVIHALASLLFDGVRAASNFGETVRVLVQFLRGRSHRAFPLPKAQLYARKIRALQEQQAALSAPLGPPPGERFARYEDLGGPVPSEPDESFDRRPSDTESSSFVGPAPAEAASIDLLSRAADDSLAPVYVHRRLLFGRRGEREEWLSAVVGELLVPLSSPLSYSQSLHQLVANVMGPIQQSTVSLLPTRHPAPQWPPHYVRSAPPAGALRVETFPSPSVAGAPRRREYIAAESGSSATETTTAPSRCLPGGPCRPATSVVYRRVSSRHLDVTSKPTSSQLIASITAHHVLSYHATRQKVLIMDLDETLCHVSTSTANMLRPPTFSEVIPTASGAELFHVWVRPYARLFLSTMSRLFNMVLFTSASRPYADTILHRVDPEYTLRERYYRQDCRVVSRGTLAKMLSERRPPSSAERVDVTEGEDERSTMTDSSDTAGRGGGRWGREEGGTEGSSPVDSTSREGLSTMGNTKLPFNEKVRVLMKDLRKLKVPPELMILIDNSEECTLLNRENALIIPPFIPSVEGQKDTRRARDTPATRYDPDDDDVLLGLIPFLESLLVVPDVRSILRHGKLD